MKAELTWKGELVMEVNAPSGVTFAMKGGDDGPSPVEVFVSSVAACSAMDVISILQKMRQPVESYTIEVEWDRTPKGEWPRPVKDIRVRHIVRGVGVDQAAVEKAVKLSDEKYCSVSASLRTPPTIEMTWDVGP